jgi:F0F1-type ATP synthase membrane subunit c/vacuolar-type H+-ATPase subunit K
MLLITCIKIAVFSLSMLPLSAGIISTGILFSSMTLSVAKNPEEYENIFNCTLMGFALVETFIFLSLMICYFIFLL